MDPLTSRLRLALKAIRHLKSDLVLCHSDGKVFTQSAVEVDGGYHARRASADARRDRKLARLGYRVVRLEAALIEQLEVAVARIRAALEPPG